MKLGTAARYLAGRNAFQAVGWVGDSSGNKLITYNRVVTFVKKTTTDNISSVNRFPHGQRSVSHVSIILRFYFVLLTYSVLVNTE